MMMLGVIQLRQEEEEEDQLEARNLYPQLKKRDIRK